MSRISGVSAGYGRPRHRRREAGAVSVEMALALIGLVVVLIALTWCLGLLTAERALGEAARAAARVAARGETATATTDEARRLVPAADVGIAVVGEYVTVIVSRVVSPPGILARWGSVRLDASSVALLEHPS